MEPTADGLLARAARELASRADELSGAVEACLRHELPELWEAPDVARMATENIAEHLGAVLVGLASGTEPGLIRPLTRSARGGWPGTAHR